MALSNDLIAQLVKATSTPSTRNAVDAGTTVYGTTVISDDTTYVQIDGSEQLTPVGTTASVSHGDRVSVFIKNHAATITGNLTTPSASSDEVRELGSKIERMDIVIADLVDVGQLQAEVARIDQLIAAVGSIDDLISENISVTQLLTAHEAVIETLRAEKIDVSVVEATYATIDSLTATNATLHNLEATYADFTVATADKFAANEAAIKDLTAEKADIDFANIGEAAIKNFYATSGVIKDLVISDGMVAGELVGVTIKGDLIEAGTLKADTLIIKGEDGLYYKLNTDGATIETEQTEYNSINGSVILAQSIAATKIAVEDLVAFDATIGGFKIGETSIHSDIKETVDSAIPGIYLDKTGQMAVGDGDRYIKYYESESGEHKLEIMADNIILGTSSSDLESLLDSTIAEVRIEYALGTSATEAPGLDQTWTTAMPQWSSGFYIWQRSVQVYKNGDTVYGDPTCVSTAAGVTGDDMSSVTNTLNSTVKDIRVEYALSTSSTSAPSNTSNDWSTAMPKWVTGNYIWQRVVQVLTNGTEVPGNPTCLSTAAGVTGDDLTAQREEITDEYTSTMNDILEAYVNSKTYDEFRVAVDTKLSVLSDSVNIKVQEVIGHIENINGELQTQLNTITKYFSFDVNGLTIGQVDNPNKVVIDNDEIAIKVGDTTVQKFDAEGKATIPNLTIGGNLDMFGFQWTGDGEGNLNFEYVGGGT